MTYVRVMTDYSSSALWEPTGSMMDESDLPVSDATKARLKKWQDEYDKTEFYLPKAERRPTTFDLGAHSREGLSIARAIKQELPDWTVVFFDAQLAEVYRSGPREKYEYEVKESDA